MRIEKPDHASVLVRTYRWAGDGYLSLTVLCGFALDAPQRLLSEQELWGTVQAQLGKDVIFDLGMPKPRGEFLLAGRAYAHGGNPVTGLEVTVQVGSLKKRVHVFGDRVWQGQGLRMPSSPQPFTEMELSYRRAFGGPGYAKNPIGRGAAPIQTDTGAPIHPLPNIEDPTALISTPEDRPEPAGFGPLDLSWPPRSGKLGSYDEAWLKNSWPYLPDDVDWSCFIAAPPDQQVPHYFNGDEELTLINLHPSQPVLHSHLPGLRVLSVIHRTEPQQRIHVEEFIMRCTVVWLFPSALAGILVYRAVIPVADEDAEEIAALTIGIERQREPPKPQAFSLGAAKPAADVKPPSAEAEAAAAAIQAGIPRPALPLAPDLPPPPPLPADIVQLERQLAGAEADLADAFRTLGLKGSEAVPDLETAPALPPEAYLKELASRLAHAEQQLTSQLEGLGTGQAGRPGAGALAEAASWPIDPAMQAILDPLQIEAQALQHQLSALMAHAEQALAQAPPPPPLKAPPAVAPKLVAPEPSVTAAAVQARHQAGHSLAGMALERLDLSGLHLAGADLRGARLAGARLIGTHLAGARLDGADLTGADCAKAGLSQASLTQSVCAGANFAEADLSQANLTEADFTGAILTKATLAKVLAIKTQLESAGLQEVHAPHGDFSGADLSRADLSQADCSAGIFNRARLHQATLSQAKFTNAQARQADFTAVQAEAAGFQQADLSQADFSGAALAKADFTKAQLPSASFEQAKGQAAKFQHADLSRSTAALGTVLPGADFQAADLSRACWIGADINHGLFASAKLDAGNFSRCKLQGSVLTGSTAREATFDKADLTGAMLDGVNLFQGSLRKARLSGISARRANCYGADFYRATMAHANLDGANLTNAGQPEAQ